MSRIQVWNMAGEEVKKMNIKNEVFGIEPNTAVMHAAVVNYLANQRQGTQSTLTRTEVSGGGHPRTAVDTRRRCTWPEAARLQLLLE